MATKTNISIARAWGVDRISVGKWITKYGASVVRDDTALAERLLGTTGVPDRILARAREILGIVPGDDPALDVGAEALDAIDDLPELARRVTSHLSEAERRMREARDPAARNEARKAFRELASTLTSIRRTQAAIGQDAGELIAKAEAMRMVSAWASRAAIGVQKARDQLIKHMPQEETVAAALMDDALIRELFLAPFKRAVSLPAECNLPEWMVNEVVKQVGNFVANGEKELAGLPADA